MNVSEEVLSGAGTYLENILFSTFYVLIFAVAVPGNAVALWAFFRQENTSPSVVFLRHLSVADMSYILILPMRIAYHLSDGLWPFGRVLCELSGFLFYLNMYCSLYLMSLISLDRLVAVVFPLRSSSIRKAKYARITVGVLWVTVIVSMSPMLFSLTKETSAAPGVCNRLYLEKTNHRALVSTIVAFVIPLTTVVVSYVLILWKLRTVKQSAERPVKGKAVRMIALVLVNFLCAFAPYHVSRIVYIETSTHGIVTAEGRANKITSALTCVSAVLDPVMYFFLNRGYRNKWLQLFYKSSSDQ